MSFPEEQSVPLLSGTYATQLNDEADLEQHQQPLITRDSHQNKFESSDCYLSKESCVSLVRTDTDEEEPVKSFENLQKLKNVFPRWTGLLRVMKLAGSQPFHLYLGCIVLVIRLPFSLSIPHFISSVLASIGRGDFPSARKNILLLLICGTIDSILDFWCVILFGWCNLNIVKSLRVDTFAAILRQEMAFFDANKSGELASHLNADCGAVGGDLAWFFRFSIESIVRISGITIYMFVRSPILGGCAMSIIPFVAVINKKYGDWLRKNAADVQSALAEANSVSLEALSCIKTIVSLSSETYEQNRYFAAISKLYKISCHQLYAEGLYYMLVSTFLINTCVQSLLLWIGMRLIEENRFDAEVLLAFMLYQGQLQSEVLNLFNSFTSLMKSSGAGEKIFAIFDRQIPAPGMGSTEVVKEDDITDIIKTVAQPWNITFSKINFSYPSRKDQIILQDLNLNVSSGSTVALVGKSGCGKTTILALLQRFYDPAVGTIFIDGKDLRSIPLSSYRRRIGTVPQDPVLFAGSIKDNISYGYDESCDEKVEEAARLANAHDFIQGFPEKYDTQVGERGVQLSGGQKQRIAIARAIIRRPALLLLDEATSALDSESEKVVQHALDDLLSRKGNMTIIVIAHRLQTVRNADCIAVIDQGRVVEKGSHVELMNIQYGHYRQMVERATGSGDLLASQT